MSWMDTLMKQAGKLNPRVLAFLEKRMKNIPSVAKKIEGEYAEIMTELETSVKPYKNKFTAFSQIPAKGWPHADILNEMEAMRALEESHWKDGFISGAVYHGDQAHIDFLNQVYALNSQSNPLHADVWPSATKFEAEIVSMTAAMLGGAGVDACGTLSSGGTESIMLAMKTYRDWAREVKGITRPEMIVPVTAHAAFDKASQYFNIKTIHVPVDENFRADLKAVKKAISKNTIVIVGSAPSFPHGAIDPIAEMSELARQHNIGFHTDACLGGFVLPWAEKLGYDVPAFDFRLAGVTSISVDTHKYGYAAKGTSVILYRNQELRRFQYYTTTEWPGGLYFSPTFAGSRPGALSAACWAALTSIGEEGYLAATKRILETAEKIKQGIREIPELYVLGDPFFVVAFASESLNVYKVLDHMAHKKWSLNGLHKPTCVHLCVTLRHTQPGVAERFLTDLREAVEHVKGHPEEKGSMAPVYGMAATIPMRGMVSDLLKKYLDLIFKV
ncbi:MAG TPA: aminotransferase class V-fold PLP-dependent enzyme [Anaerolineales bacterium]|nr:aminotransferase class V-fold PLP-dependent enzyme [Anaerolineales bacterium]HNB87716.1 aminotransferase class V-fold PLP-dependent enzyme [Anaerolineales bacterium]HND92617.1 aminotransferase class V-fold PLP-dependent enzyme [Anaerolineales bacterium]HNH06458.1 aminotransferase class V-fold PLP-dependent enzyme [Anaerolineales bacterium]